MRAWSFAGGALLSSLACVGLQPPRELGRDALAEVDAADEPSDAHVDALDVAPDRGRDVTADLADGAACEAGGALCRARCVDLGSDPSNCGACGVDCPLGLCAFGRCTVAVEVAAGGAHTCARMSDTTTRCWGANNLYQTGDVDPTFVTHLRPYILGARIGLTAQVAAGGSHTCVLTAPAGEVWCWGANDRGQLGTTPLAMRRATVERVPGLSGALQIAAGFAFSCAITASRGVACWGSNSMGQLGAATPGPSAGLLTVPDLANVAEIALGGEHACARVVGSGAVYCWGKNFEGQLGDGTTTARTTPRAVPMLTDIAEIAASATHTCARSAMGGTVRCWGDNTWGFLGDGTTTARRSPVAVMGLASALQVEAGFGHTCARTGSNVICWGLNRDGQLGDATPAPMRTAPWEGTRLSGATQITVNGVHACARLSNGTVRCWGNNMSGQLGDGTTANRSAPTAVVWR